MDVSCVSFQIQALLPVPSAVSAGFILWFGPVSPGQQAGGRPTQSHPHWMQQVRHFNSLRTSPHPSGDPLSLSPFSFNALHINSTTKKSDHKVASTLLYNSFYKNWTVCIMISLFQLLHWYFFCLIHWYVRHHGTCQKKMNKVYQQLYWHNLFNMTLDLFIYLFLLPHWTIWLSYQEHIVITYCIVSTGWQFIHSQLENSVTLTRVSFWPILLLWLIFWRISISKYNSMQTFQR